MTELKNEPETVERHRIRAIRISASGAFLMFLAVLTGAFGAHALKQRLDDYSIGIYQLAVSYQIYHALGLVAVGLLALAGALSSRSATRVAGTMLAGVLIFSGSLYLLAITGIRMFGAITPIGGILLLVSWLMLSWKLWGARDCN